MRRLYRALAYLTLMGLFLVPIAHSQSVSRGVTTWHADENFVVDVQAEFNIILGLINGPKPVGIPYDFIAVPAGNVVLRFVAPVPLPSPANLAGGTSAPATLCNAKTASTGTAVFSIQKNDSQVATATFTTAATCTLSTQAAFNLATGDTLTIVSPGSPDATLANIAITVGATR